MIRSLINKFIHINFKTSQSQETKFENNINKIYLPWYNIID